nr:MAG TPA: hypothetical protein [Caudoviricetes sp.]
MSFNIVKKNSCDTTIVMIVNSVRDIFLFLI